MKIVQCPMSDVRCRKIKIKNIFLFLILSMTLDLGPWTLDSYAAFSSSDKGTTSAGFLKLAAGARAAALGEAFTAMANDATALYWNPAALTRLSRKSATFMHALHLDSSFFDYVAYGQPILFEDVESSARPFAGPLTKSQADKIKTKKIPYGYFGTSLQYWSAGSISRTDTTGTDIGSFSPKDIALALGYAHKFDIGSVGAGFKYVQSSILDSASTFAFDFGLLSSKILNNKLQMGFSLTNVGGSLKYEEESDPLPMTIRLGSAYYITKQWAGALDIVAPIDNAPYLALGSEYVRPIKKDWLVALRGGYNTRSTSDLSGLSGLTFGFGLNVTQFGFDYAFVPFGDLGLTHRLSFSAKF